MFATVHLDTHFNAGVVDRRIFGGFLEHLGRAVYGGVYDPGNAFSDGKGFRQDVLNALRPMGMPIIRYPGGNYVSAFDWRDAVGPKDQRKKRLDYAWNSVESNQFGINEFLSWCKELKTEAMMAVNLGTLGATEAAALVEYCNYGGGTYWSDLRRQHGVAEPYGIKLWCLGNEMDGPWQAGHVPPEVYAQRAFQASFLMKGMDPSIQTIACGSSGNAIFSYPHWDRVVLEYCWLAVDYLSAHRYSDNKRGDTAWFLAEGVEIDEMLRDYAGLISYVRALRRSSKKVYLSFDEWNVWYRERGKEKEVGNWASAPPLLEERYNLEDALVVAQYLSAFVRRADLVKVACIAQIVNVIAPITTSADGVLLHPIYYPFVLFSQNARGLSLTPSIACPMYEAGARGEQPCVDASATFDEATGEVAVFLVNRRQDEAMTVTVELADRVATRGLLAEVLSASDVKAENSWQEPERVVPHRGTAVVTDFGGVQISIPAPGFAAVKFATRLR